MAEKTKKTSEKQQEQIIIEQDAEIAADAPELSSAKAAEILQQDDTIKMAEKIDDLNDKLLRAMAEAQNTRRRADIDINNARSFGIWSFAKDLLSVMDNLIRAADTISTESAAADPLLKNIKDGIEITKREMINVLERNGIKRIEPIGAEFDPNLHQAISQVQDENIAPGVVMQVLQSGYVLKDRLLRPALVVVSKAA